MVSRDYLVCVRIILIMCENMASIKQASLNG